MSVNPITNNLRLEVEILSFVSAGFVPLSLAALGYVDSLQKTKTRRVKPVGQVNSVKPVVQNEDKKVLATENLTLENVNKPVDIDNARAIKVVKNTAQKHS